MFIAIENYSFQISPKISGCLIAKIQFQVELVVAFAGARHAAASRPPSNNLKGHFLALSGSEC
jgi:hypothetical protein